MTTLVVQRNVDDGLVPVLLVEHVGTEQAFTLAQAERIQVDVVALQPHTRVVERGDAGRGHEDAPPLAACNEAEHSRCLVSASRHDDDVVDFADRGAASVKQRQPHDAVRVDEVRCWRHEARLPMHPRANLAISLIF